MISKTILNQLDSWHSQGQSIVLVTGVFDILHIEHFRFLKKAKDAGDKLIVAIESDSRVKQIKGDNRPANNQKVRLEQLNALKSVDLVLILPSNFSTQSDWEDFMETLKPDIYAVSSHTSYLENKRRISQKYGVKLKIVHQFNPAISTSKLISKIQKEI